MTTSDGTASDDAVQQNVILAGVGGQGILTIAEAISGAALRRGLQVKQAEVHGMASAAAACSRTCASPTATSTRT